MDINETAKVVDVLSILLSSPLKSDFVIISGWGILSTLAVA